MSIAIMCSGGDAAGMNPAIKQFVEYSFELGIKPYLIYDGLEGLIDDEIKEATHERVGGIIHRGGTVIRSSRSKRFFEIEHRKIAYENLKSKGIDKLVVLGGDGSFRAMRQFYHDFGVNFVGIPTTIDNDIFGTDYCLGVDTALNVIRESIDDIRDTAASFKRAFVIETMGRDCGYLALVSALTSGAEMLVVPEIENDFDALEKRFKQQIKEGRSYIIAIVAEGAKMSDKVAAWFKDNIGMESRVSVIGHIQRGGSPSVFDRLMAFEFAKLSIDKLMLKPDDRNVIVYKESKFDFVSIDYINSQKYQIKPDLIKLAKKLTR
ncbi:MAG: 6-phosphofructokinase [Campylobacteraceae bacterium]|jgi:6-phosphofructokinase 1|nr:6-phosphofructokinase [Campylobacteraceae bacterium]